MKKKVALHNLGCKVNAYEVEAMQQLLEKAGYEIVPFTEGADVYLINTCTVTNIADRKSRQMLHKAKKMNPDAVVVATGCYVQTDEGKLDKDDAVDLILGNNQKKNIVEVLEEYEHAKARGAKIYCELAGYGATCDAYHMTAPADECGASSKAMIEAYTEAGLKPEDITYINAHGTSTHLNDMLETKAVKIALGEEQARKVKINSTKSMTGHMLGGTGAVEAAVCALSIRDGFIHQTIGYTTPDPECDLDYCVDGPVEMPVNAALSNSLGFGGHNATLCFKKCVD